MLSQLCGFVAIVALMTQPTSALELCQTVTGFAAGQNNAFDMVPNIVVRQNEAIVLGVKGLRPGFPVAMNVSFVNDGIARVFHTDPSSPSDDGLVVLRESIAVNTALTVRIFNFQPTDEPAPFVFYSYVVNTPYCFIDLTPLSAFTGALPRDMNGPIEIYLRSAAPIPTANQPTIADFTAQAVVTQPFPDKPFASPPSDQIEVTVSKNPVAGDPSVDRRGVAGSVLVSSFETAAGAFAYVRVKSPSAAYIKVACRWQNRAAGSGDGLVASTSAPGIIGKVEADVAKTVDRVESAGSGWGAFFFLLIAVVAGMTFLKVRHPALYMHVITQAELAVGSILGLLASGVSRITGRSSTFPLGEQAPVPTRARGGYDPVGQFS